MDSSAPLVLVLEDSVLVAMAIEAALADRGLAVVAAGSVAAARDRLSRAPVAAALLDLQLPDGNSLELARELNAAGCPVAICSGLDGGAAADGLPATKHFLKPVDAEILAAWVADALASPEEDRPS